MEELLSDIERAESLQSMLLSRATGGYPENAQYKLLRAYFVSNSQLNALLPSFVRSNRDLEQFWSFIKARHDNYQDRRNFIWGEFTQLINHLEGNNQKPSDDTITNGLKIHSEEYVNDVWVKALARRNEDPEGAITAARTLLEAVCKHILDEAEVSYDKDKTELPDLYKLTAKELNIAPSQHTAEIFKQILGGVSSVVNGLGGLRNRLGDAHGKGKSQVKPLPRHAQLAVNLAGATALFLIETWKSKVPKANED